MTDDLKHGAGAGAGAGGGGGGGGGGRGGGGGSGESVVSTAAAEPAAVDIAANYLMAG